MMVKAPCPITADHGLAQFSCGIPSLDEWLKKRALGNERAGVSRSYVICDGNHVVGYYALAMGSVARGDVPRNMRHGMPDPIPAIILGRLAVDRKYQGRNLGTDLMGDAILRSLQASEIVAGRVMLVHAISEAAKEFYLAYGFMPLPAENMTLYLPLDAFR